MGLKRARHVVAVLFILAPLLFTLVGPPPDAAAQSVAPPATSVQTAAQQAASSGSRKVIVDNDDKQTVAAIAARGGLVLVDYGSFSLWSVLDQAVATVQSRASVAIPDKLDTIALLGGNVV